MEEKRLQNNIEWYIRFCDELKETISRLEKIENAAANLFFAEWGKPNDRPEDSEPDWQALHSALYPEWKEKE